MIMSNVSRVKAESEPLKGLIVRDNFFTDELNSLIARSTEDFQWRYWRPVTDDSDKHKTFVSLLWNDSSEDNFYKLIWRTIQNQITDLGNCHCYRIIANGTVKGQNIGWHRDNGYKTVLYFPNSWRSEWGGSTYFKVDDSQTEIAYVQNRIIIFEASLLHFGACPTVTDILRVSIAFNLRAIDH
jgi:hypothetical protein